MENELNFTSKSLLEKKFKKGDVGYDPYEVDLVLDQIIEDYRKIESSSQIDVKALIQEIADLRKENQTLKDALEKEQKKFKYLPKDKEVHIDNYELLQRIGKLEMIIYERLNLNPDEIK